eukprot:1180947-Prorocentrum_minimum.AAC.1
MRLATEWRRSRVCGVAVSVPLFHPGGEERADGQFSADVPGPPDASARPDRAGTTRYTSRGRARKTQTCDVRKKELVGELNSRVTRWLNKLLMVRFAASVSSPASLVFTDVDPDPATGPVGHGCQNAEDDPKTPNQNLSGEPTG